jgi:hypothetical protein
MLSQLFAGSVIDKTKSHHMNATTKPTIYIVSHLFSYIDILLALDTITKNTIGFRKLVGVTNAPPLPQTLMMEMLNLLSDKIEYVSYNTRDGNTSRILARELRYGNDIIIWQHPNNHHKSLYYLLRDTRSRLVYIDISDNKTKRTINNDDPFAILLYTSGRNYIIQSWEIDYSKILSDDEIDIIRNFNIPLWKLCCSNH